MKPFKTKSTLKTRRCHLVPITSTHIQALVKILSQPAIRHYTGSVAHQSESVIPFTKEYESTMYAFYDEVFNDPYRLDYAIFYHDILIGECVINEYDSILDTANFRINIDTAYQNQGFAQEVIPTFINYAFSSGLHRIELEVLEYNPCAKHVYERVGFIYEGCARKAFPYNDTYFDIFHYSLLNNELKR